MNFCKYLTSIISIFLISLNLHSQEESFTETYTFSHSEQKSEDEVKNYVFGTIINTQKEYRKYFHPQIVEFKNGSPHKIHVYYANKNINSGQCSILIDIIDKKGNILKSLNSTPNNKETDIDLKEGSWEVIIVDGIKYEFKINKCSWIWQSYADITIIKREEKSKSGNDIKQTVNSNDISKSLKYKIDYKEWVQYKPPKVLRVPKGDKSFREVQFGTITESKVHFEREKNWDIGINRFVEIKRAVSKAISATFGLELIDTDQTTVHYSDCDTWLVEKQIQRGYGYFSAPHLNIGREIPFSIILDTRLIIIPLCPDDTNITNRDSIIKIEKEILERYSTKKPWYQN